jgi:pimeloyl-ACP methyl ester carboxylesterase
MTFALETRHLLPRRTIALRGDDIAYADEGAGPPALFVHGVILNADLWRNVIEGVSDLRRCIAVDLPMHGASRAGPDSDLSLTGLAAMLEQFCCELDLGQIDLVANDTGGAVAQILAAHHPERLRTLTLTNCDVHENFPPERFRANKDLAAKGEFGPLIAAAANDPSLARSKDGFGLGYQHPEALADELIRSYLGPFVGDVGKGLERFMTASSAEELMAVEPQLRELRVPTLIAWGTGDLFFEPFWADRLREMIPGVEQVVEIRDAMLFYPDERASELIPHVRAHWEAHNPLEEALP